MELPRERFSSTVWLCVVRDFKTINFQFSTILINAKNFNISTLPALRIAFVCAQHEHEHTLLKALNKFVKYKFYREKGRVGY